ncbi:MAG: serpin family protein, partial [Gemmataceae bacterium]
MTPTKQLPLFLALMVSVVFVFGDTALAEEKRQDPATKVVEGNNEFALDLYKKFAADNKTKNIFFSPYSITQALAMTFEGARAKTALEMGKVLRLPEYVRQVGNDQRPWQTEKFNAILASLNARLTPPKAAETKKFQQKADVLQKKLDDLNTLYQTLLNKREFARARTVHAQARKTAETLNDVYRQFGQYELTLANALWGEQTYPFDKGYLANVNRHFKSGGLRLADFRNNFEAERLRINAWIEKQTRDRIKDILQKGDLNRLTRLVLANAIYFKGQW